MNHLLKVEFGEGVEEEEEGMNRLLKVEIEEGEEGEEGMNHLSKIGIGEAVEEEEGRCSELALEEETNANRHVQQI